MRPASWSNSMSLHTTKNVRSVTRRPCRRDRLRRTAGSRAHGPRHRRNCDTRQNAKTPTRRPVRRARASDTLTRSNNSSGPGRPVTGSKKREVTGACGPRSIRRMRVVVQCFDVHDPPPAATPCPGRLSPPTSPNVLAGYGRLFRTAVSLVSARIVVLVSGGLGGRCEAGELGRLRSCSPTNEEKPMLNRQKLTQIGLGLLGAAVLAVGGAGFLTTSNAADTSPACTQGTAGASAGTQAGAGGSSTGANGSLSAGTGTPRSGSAPNPVSGVTPSIPSVPGLPERDRAAPRGSHNGPARGVPRRHEPGAVLDAARHARPAGDRGARGQGVFVGATTPSSQTGATVTPDSSGTGSHVGIVGAPGSTGSLSNIGL